MYYDINKLNEEHEIALVLNKEYDLEQPIEEKETNAVLYFVVLGLAFLTYPIWWLLNWLIDWWTPTYTKEGIYAVVGRTGSGKSLFKTYLELQKEGGSNITMTNVDSPSENAYTEKIEDIWHDDETHVNFNGSNVDLMTFDEIHVEFDNRDFKNEKYKKTFQPFAKFGTLHRHQKVKRIFFFASSWESMDTKLKRLTHYVIDIDHTKMINIPYMVETHKIERIPKTLQLTVFKKQDYEDNKEYFEQVKSGFFNTKITLADLDRYRIGITKELLKRHDTYVFEDYYKDKPVYVPTQLKD